MDKKMVVFDKKIEGLAIGNKRPPTNCHELKNEIKKWPRIGMPNQDNVQKSGFVRYFDFSHIYPKIDKDVERLINEGYLFEFTDMPNLHDKIKKDPGLQKGKEKMPTLLYPVNIPEDLSDNKVELRGSVGAQSQSKYPMESLNIMSQLFNDFEGPQKKIEDFKWEEVIEDKNTKLLDDMDEEEKNRYWYRKQTKNTFLPENDPSQSQGQEKRGR